MRQEKKQKDRPAVILVLCFCLMALVSVFVVKANIDKVKSSMQSTKTAEVVKKKSVNSSDKSGSGEKTLSTAEKTAAPATTGRLIRNSPYP